MLKFILNSGNAEAPSPSIAAVTAANISMEILKNFKALSMHPASVLLKQICVLK